MTVTDSINTTIVELNDSTDNYYLYYNSRTVIYDHGGFL